MQKIALHFVRTVHHINDWVGRQVSWLTLALVLLVCWDVAMRYLFQQTSVWFMELEWHLYAALFLLGAGYTLMRDRHVRVDLFYSEFTPKDKALVNFLGAIIFLIPWSLLLLVVSYQYAWVSWLIQEGSPDPGGLPARYVIKFCITLGAFLLFLQALAEAVKHGLLWRGNLSPEALAEFTNTNSH